MYNRIDLRKLGYGKVLYVPRVTRIFPVAFTHMTLQCITLYVVRRAMFKDACQPKVVISCCRSLKTGREKRWRATINFGMLDSLKGSCVDITPPIFLSQNRLWSVRTRPFRSPERAWFGQVVVYSCTKKLLIPLASQDWSGREACLGGVSANP